MISALPSTQLTVSWTALTELEGGHGSAIINDGYTVQWKSGDQDYSSSDRQATPTDAMITLGGTGGNGTLDRRYGIHGASARHQRRRRRCLVRMSSPGRQPTCRSAPTVAADDGVMAGYEQLTVDWVEAPEANGAAITEYTVRWRK